MDDVAVRQVLVTGSRKLTWSEHGRRISHDLNAAMTLFGPMRLIHGGCPSGADDIAYGWARRVMHAQGDGPLQVLAVPAQWDIYGRAAGPIRNKEMVAMLRPNTDLVLAYPMGESPGTRHTIGLAFDKGLTVIVREMTTTRGGA